MKSIKLVFVSSIMWFGLTTLNAQEITSEVTTLAGSGSSGSADGTGMEASFNTAYGLAVDGSGNVYVADTGNNMIRKITSAGVVTTLAGSTFSGNADGTGTAASFFIPHSVIVDGSGNVYVADSGNFLIRKITSAGAVTTLAGSGSAGNADGTGTAASFNRPIDVAVDGSGNVYVADIDNHLIRKITSAGVVTTLAGSGSEGSADGTGTAASFNNPRGVAVDGSGNVYVADIDNHLIRKITSAGVVTTLAGSGSAGNADGTGTAASFNGPVGVAVDGIGNVYVADIYNHLIRKITSAGVVTTLAGSGSRGNADGTGTEASFKYPSGVAVDGSGNVYVADIGNNLIRKIVFPPSPFDLVYPLDSTTVVLTRDNFLDTLYFAWNQSVDTQPVTYRRELTGDLPEYIRFIDPEDETQISEEHSLSFDGVDDYVDLGTVSTNFIDDFSIQAWVKTSSSNSQGIMTKSNGDQVWEAGEFNFYMTAAGEPNWVGYGLNYIQGKNLGTSDGEWHHLIVVWDYDGSGTTGTGRVYIDGLDFTGGSSYTTLNGTDPGTNTVYIAAPNHGESANYFDGNIKEFAIWSYALSSSEVSLLYNGGLGEAATTVQEDNLDGYWRLGEGSGTVVNDKSDNDNNGTIEGAIWATGQAYLNNMYKVPYHHIEHYMHEAGVELISGTWTIVATDGTYDTYAANGPFSLTIDGSQLGIEAGEMVPESFALHANFPNPFNPSTTISYDLPKRSQVTLGIYDLLGKQIKTLVNQSQDAGNKIAIWDGTDDLGRQVSAGVYLYQIQAGEFTQTRKMLLLK